MSHDGLRRTFIVLVYILCLFCVYILYPITVVHTAAKAANSRQSPSKPVSTPTYGHEVHEMTRPFPVYHKQPTLNTTINIILLYSNTIIM